MILLRSGAVLLMMKEGTEKKRNAFEKRTKG